MTKVIEKLNRLSKQELDDICKEMKEKGWINKGLTPNATPCEKNKYEICQNILRYKRENNLNEKELGKKLGIKKQEKLEHLLFCHIEHFSLDELIAYWGLISDEKIIIKNQSPLYNKLATNPYYSWIS